MTPLVLITGSSSGIGRATAERFLEAGWRVYATARDPDDVADLAERGCRTPSLDVTDPTDVDRVVARLDREAGRLDCLVNNAGYGQYGPLEDVPTGGVRDQFGVNVIGPHRLCRAFLPLLRAGSDVDTPRTPGTDDRSSHPDGHTAGSPHPDGHTAATGTIVSVSSLAAQVPYPGAGVYCASKAALEAHHDALRVEVAPEVAVVLVEPGPVPTGFRARRESEMATLDVSDAYDAVYEAHRGETTRSALFGDVGAPDVADVVFDVATASDPPARAPVGWRVGVAVWLARRLPRRWVERVIDRL